MLVRITPGIEADTHESIRTGHLGSKFGVTPDEARVARGASVDGAPRPRRLAAARARGRARDDRVAEPLPRRDELDAARRRPRRRARRADAAGRARAVDRGVRRRASRRARTSTAQVILEPGRSLVGAGRRDALPRRERQALGRPRRGSRSTAGISDNARPQLYDARYTAVVATRMDARADRGRTASPGSTASRETC